MIADQDFNRHDLQLISKVEGKGNGIRTVIPNMSDIAKSLSRPSTYPTKFFGCELGAQVKCDEKNSKYVVNGAHHSERLQELLDGFIEKFVLCPSCRNPETDLIVVNKNEILRNCKACGAVLPVDMRHKLCTWIFKNPPQNGRNDFSVSTGSVKKRLNDKSDPKRSPSQNDINAEKRNLSISTSCVLGVSLSGSCLLDSNDPFLDAASTDNEFYTDQTTGESCIEHGNIPSSIKSKSVGAITSGLNKLCLSSDANVSDTDEDSLEKFGLYLSETPDATSEDVISRANSLRPDKVSAILPQVLFTKDMLENKEVEKFSPLIRNFTKTERAQKAFLGGVERLVGIKIISLLPRVSLIFKELYDHDIVDESTFLSWGEKPGKKYVDRKTSKEIHTRAQSFLDWLRDAEEESSSECECPEAGH